MRPKRQNVALAVLGSVLLHGIALLLFALIVALKPPAPPETPPEEPMRLEMVQEAPPETPPVLEAAPTPTPTPTPVNNRIVDSSGPDSDSPPPADAFESDRNTRASSVNPSDGSRPGTNQAGQRMASFQFDPSPPAPGLITHAEPPPETAPTLPKPDRTARRPPPTPHPYAEPPPSEEAPAPTADPNEFAVAMATPTPLPEDPFDPSIRSSSPPLPKPAPRPGDKSTPMPPVGASRSAEDGASANRGPGGVNTRATPGGRYTRKVTDMIKFIWSRSIESRGDLTYGKAVVHCAIDQDGHVLDPHVLSNSSDPVFGSVALQAVVVARLPPMPDDVVKELDGKLALDITFDLTPLPQEAALH